jgi:hypothetical protein
VAVRDDVDVAERRVLVKRSHGLEEVEHGRRFASRETPVVTALRQV